MRGNGNEALGYLIVVFFLIWLVVKIAIWSIKIILIVLAIAIGLAIIALIPGLIIWLFIQVFKQMRQQEFERVRAILLPILTILMGISIGFCIQLGFSNIWAIAGIFSSSLPLVSILLYPPINRRRLIRQYRDKEQHLIEP
ncbi:MAG: hypothetical protein HC847_18995 [Hydrococcus sp. RU_2_2]|nr:hypothetical protein [Hydrococcus sp. RU_2_2]NJQ96639.1 hypothetical protein [Hydrococcus sp. CSU_1_8]